MYSFWENWQKVAQQPHLTYFWPWQMTIRAIQSNPSLESSLGMKRMKARTANNPNLDKAVFTWFVKVRQAGTRVPPLVALFWVSQAQKFHKDLHADDPGDFVASKGKLHRFHNRHGISQVKITGEVRLADTVTAELLPSSRLVFQTRSTTLRKLPSITECYKTRHFL